MSVTLSGVRADRGYSYRKLEKIADHVRRALSYPPDQPIDPLNLFESLHTIRVVTASGAEIPLEIRIATLEDSEGYTRFDRSEGVIEVIASDATYQWMEESHPRSAYFVAHELGHCLLHTDQLVRLAQMPKQQQAAFHRGRLDHAAYADTEWQANAFAGALLMPASGIQALETKFGFVLPSLVAHVFRVSHEAAGIRMEIYRNRKTQLLS